jgi:isoleucyl-tRNA synthetase
MEVPRKYDPDRMERSVLEKWRADKTFERQVEAGRRRFEESGDAHKFIFLEGPPTANGLPHPGHVLTRTLKDSVNRYHAMLGKWVPRKAGWDCHGLPVEIEVQKELGIEHVDEVLAYGLAKFNAKCRESVFRYKQDWEEMSERVGFWMDYDDPYATMDDGYIESVWWSLKRLFDAGLLFKGHKVVPYCPQTGTTYSTHEVAQGYKDVTDTSVYVKFRLHDGASILSWTTTPWTLPGNVALAVGADVDYVRVKVLEASDKAHAEAGEELVLAKALVKAALRNKVEVIAEMKGRDLVGKRYEPLFAGAINPAADGAPWPVDQEKAWTILAAEFVTTQDGTGVVHTAVMYGEDDYQLGQVEGLPAQHTVGLDGAFTAAVKGFAGMAVKAAETEAALLASLHERGLLYRQESYEHSYPHCWRTGHPLLYYAMDSWFVRMSSLRDALLANNQHINWVPDTIKEGRMGDWLRNVKDWAFSRNRFWGTPLPVWICPDGHETCLGSKAELAEHGIKVPELHRPHVDVPIACPAATAAGTCGKPAQREPYVIDVWYDSGAAQFAQWKATSLEDPHLRSHWPIDFIAEGLDQTRGWFYSLLASATALGASDEAKQAGLFQGPPYRNVVVNGLILAEDGQKMSKSKKNYVSPDQVFKHQGADATRWYLLSATAPWQDKRFYEDAVRDTFGRFFSTLWNTYLFQHQYAALDGWKPDLKTLDGLHETDRPLDQWLLSRLESTVATAREEAGRYNLHKATRAIEQFVLEDLSNWWVRRSRDRFWQETDTPDKRSAHATLWWALHSTCRMVAPFAPFMVEHIWQGVRLAEDPDSVHLAHFPEPGPRNEELEIRMDVVRSLAEAGRALRSKVGIPTRHPLAEAVLVGEADGMGELLEALRDELNVKKLGSDDVTRVRSFVAKPNRAALGPAFKQLAPKVAQAIEALPGDATHAQLQRGPVHVSIEGREHALVAELFEWEQRDRDDWATVNVGQHVLALNTARDQGLLDEAFVREVIRRIQELRKELDLDIGAEIGIQLAVQGEAPQALRALQTHAGVVASEVRANAVEVVPALAAPDKEWRIDDVVVQCAVSGLPEGAKAA